MDESERKAVMTSVSRFKSAADAHRRLKSEITTNRALMAALAEAKANDAIFIANKGNLGDALIQLGTYTLFDEIGWSPRVKTGFSSTNYPPSGWVVVGGGGAWVEGFLEEQGRCAREFLERGGKMVLLPSSVLGFQEYFRRYSSQVQIFVRENFSFESLKTVPGFKDRVHLCHDLAFAVNPVEFSPFGETIRSGAISLFREDGESAMDSLPPSNFDLAMVANNGLWGSREECVPPILSAAKLISQFEIVRTDRLHMSVLSAMLGCDVEMHSNSYFKNAGVFEYSLRHFSNVTFKASNMSESAGHPVGDIDRRQLASIHGPHAAELVSLCRLRREYFEPELIRLHQQGTELTERIRETEAALADLARERVEWFEPQLQQLTNDVVPKLENEVTALRLELSRVAEFEGKLRDLEPSLKFLSTEKVPQLEAEIERLRTELRDRTEVAEDRRREIETLTQDAVLRSQRDKSSLLTERARAMQYGAEIDRLTSQTMSSERRRQELEGYIRSTLEPEIESLRNSIHSFEQTRRTWFEPEIDRLNKVIAGYESVKCEWFEPQLRNYQSALTEANRQLIEAEHRRANSPLSKIRRFLGM